MPVLGGECRLDPKIVLSSEVSDSTEKSAHVIRICGERHRPPHNLSQLCGAAKLWNTSDLRVLSGVGDPWVKMRAQYNVPVAMDTAA